MNLTVGDIINATGGKLIVGNLSTECVNYSRDTRTIKNGDTFIAIKGENFDGNLFWMEALDKGADVVIINKLNLNKEQIEKYKNKCIIEVEDTLIALGKIAEFKRNLYKGKLKVIGVTGSVGKTSTKDIIANVLSKKYKTLKTEGNNNNFIGLPFTLLRLKDEEVAVIEMGMNHLGEISYLSKIAKPDISVITNIGSSHIGNLGSRENILKAKLEILDGMEEKNLVINNDNDLLHKWNLENNINTYTYGIKNNSDFMAKNIKLNETNSEFICENKNEKININVPVAGEHFILNSLSAIAVAKLLNLNNEEIINGIKDFKLTAKRMEIIHTKNNITIINDAYNASYESMKASILSLKNMNGKRKIAVLGDMFELGSFSEKLHRDVAKEIYKNKINEVYLIGENSKFIYDELINLGFNKNNLFYFTEKNLLIENLQKNLTEGDTVLIKASNGMKLYEVAQELIN